MATQAKKNLPEGKKKALETTLSMIDKQWGKGSVMLLGQSLQQKIDVVKTLSGRTSTLYMFNF